MRFQKNNLPLNYFFRVFYRTEDRKNSSSSKKDQENQGKNSSKVERKSSTRSVHYEEDEKQDVKPQFKSGTGNTL